MVSRLRCRSFFLLAFIPRYSLACTYSTSRWPYIWLWFRALVANCMGWREVLRSGSAELDRVSTLDCSSQVHPKSLSCNTSQSGTKGARSGGKGYKGMGGAKQDRQSKQFDCSCFIDGYSKRSGEVWVGITRWLSFSPSSFSDFFSLTPHYRQKLSRQFQSNTVSLEVV